MVEICLYKYQILLLYNKHKKKQYLLYLWHLTYNTLERKAYFQMSTNKKYIEFNNILLQIV